MFRISHLAFLTIGFVLFHFIGMADIKSTSGNLHLDVNNDGQSEITISSVGLGVGVSSPSSNLHVSGNMSVPVGNIGIGTTSPNSSLEINGTFGFNIETISSNTTLSGNSIILANTSSSNITITLPTGNSALGRHYNIKKIRSAGKLHITGGMMDDLSNISFGTGNQILPSISLIHQNSSQWYINYISGLDTSVSTDNLMIWLKFEDESGTNAVDSSGNTAGGTLEGSMTFSGCSVSGIFGNALSFDGSDDRILLPSFGEIGDFTFSAWVKVDSGTTRAYLFDSGATDRVVISLNNADGAIDYFDGSHRFGTITMNDGNWHHVAVTESGGNYVLYVNGTDSVSGTGNDVSLNASNVRVGSLNSGTNEYWPGEIDDLRVYSRALSASEISALFQEGE